LHLVEFSFINRTMMHGSTNIKFKYFLLYRTFLSHKLRNR